MREWYFAELGGIVADELSPPTGEQLEEVNADAYYGGVGHDLNGLRVPDDLDESIYRYQRLLPNRRAKFDRATYWLSMASRQWEDSMSSSFASLVSSAEALTDESAKRHLYCGVCERSHDVPGSTEMFRTFFEKYAPAPGLKERRNEMYKMRSKILHGSDLMQLDQNHFFHWDLPWQDQFELNSELWSLMRVAARNWLWNAREN